ncbi:pyruvate dehydrogenase (acetyl-transferring) kinase isozyme 4, mitochondrial-like [Ailuropoda melanoleuca]|uniref:pyruvate dehydrogenase (acetyl-transferring) kinase isozyme 4, mitochondrial-like n=1 Tax=Ailuropoda melanoleuca TaxID=9646 RepID=UPI0014941334|nr:pyruvate dehydrogenase (acetyl-transferring) kinase isozyme 4, mitochondrial-like [Ailuropoda melanoleuca]
MRATVEHQENWPSLTPIEVIVVLGKEDLTIKISDRGGGVPLRIIERLFSYTYSTAPTPVMDNSRNAPLAGFGYGLPISRLYAKYFQGDLNLYSMSGYGTDAIIYLKVSLQFSRNNHVSIFFKILFICLFEKESSSRGRGRRRGRERISDGLPTECGARLGARSHHEPEIMT